MNIKKIVENLIDTFLKAGELSLSLREQGLTKEIKSDNTPVSNGDIEVNKFITKKISEITPDIPIISEESSDNKNNSKLKDFWLVDPIDGTYDYINDLEEFTINAGLISFFNPAFLRESDSSPAFKKVSTKSSTIFLIFIFFHFTFIDFF